jgi:hypothetical protein
MGSNFVAEIQDTDLFPNFDLRDAIGMHLRGNCYPPIPIEMADVCVEAVYAYEDGDYYRMLTLPKIGDFQVRNRDGSIEVTAMQVVENTRIEGFIQDMEYED